MRILTSRAIGTAAAAAIALSTLGLQPASAHGPQYGNNDAAAAAAMVAVFGTMAAIIASSRHRRAQRHDYGHHYGRHHHYGRESHPGRHWHRR